MLFFFLLYIQRIHMHHNKKNIIINNNNKKYIFKTPNQQIRMISERSCDTGVMAVEI